MPTVVACTHCQTRCKLGDQLIGKVVKCPRCGKPFNAVAAEADEIVLLPVPTGSTADDITAGPPALVPVKARRATEQEGRRSASRQRDDETDRPTRTRRSRKSSGNQNLIIGLCVGGGVLVLGLVILGVVLLVSSGKRRPASANPLVAEVNIPEAARPVQAAPQPVPQPVTAPEPAKPVQAAPPPPPVVPDPPAPKVVGPGKQITVRAEIQGSPPDFMGDYNKHVVQNLEIALRQLGYEPVPQGGMILQVRGQVGNSGTSIKVHTFGPSPPGPRFKPGQPAMRNPTRDAVYPVEQITATLLLTDAQGTAIWRTERKFTPHMMIFRGNPPREMQELMWRMFDTWTQGGAVATMKL